MRLEKEMEKAMAGYKKTRIRIRGWSLKWKNINKTKSFIISRQQNTVRSIIVMARNYSVHLDKHPKQIATAIAIANSEKAVEDNEMGKMLCQLVKKQSDPTVDIEESHGSPLQYSYFRSIFQELVEKKIDK